jgi:hypothetical protein
LLVIFIYRDNPALRDYAIIGGIGVALLFGMQYNAGQILDEQRLEGTLGNLFASPGPRYAWLAGFQLYAVVESLVARRAHGCDRGRRSSGSPSTSTR